MVYGKKHTAAYLRKFGITIGVALALVGSILYWFSNEIWPYLFGVSAIFLLSGFFYPRVLAPVEWVWMKFARILGFITTSIILAVTFYLVITPIGLIRRIFGKDPLSLRFDKKTESYWTPIDPNGPVSRPDKQY